MGAAVARLEDADGVDGTLTAVLSSIRRVDAVPALTTVVGEASGHRPHVCSPTLKRSSPTSSANSFASGTSRSPGGGAAAAAGKAGNGDAPSPPYPGISEPLTAPWNQDPDHA
jgi:hypothetical protein